MLHKTNQALYNWFQKKLKTVEESISINKIKYGSRLIWFSGLLSIAAVLSPLSSDFAMNLGVAGILFLSENLIEKHFNVDKDWKFSYYASQFMLIGSMILGLHFGIDKDLTVFTFIGTITLIVAILFTTNFLTYAFKRNCNKSAE